jgi:hypothetical protein|tara:strand:+ start:1001 stop:1477 length:477 start_codon:yes stop_codon:yes gene_type:complete
MNRYNMVLNRLYEDLRKERSVVDNQELGEVYSNVIELYNKSMEEKNYLQSFILIQNLYEDRLYVLYKYLTESKSGDDLSLEHYHMNVDLKKIVRELYSIHNLFDEGVKKSLNRSIDIRNRFIHFSFMKPDVYTEELSNVFYTLFREVDEEIRKFKKKS